MLNRSDRKATLPGTAELGAYFRAASGRLSIDAFNLATADTSHLSRLSAVERATVRIAAPSITERPSRAGILYEAALRLAVLSARGKLTMLSGQAVAATLYVTFCSTHPNSLRHAWKGWRLLEELDRRGLAEVRLSSVDPLDSRRYRDIRLSERADELRSERHQLAPR